MDKHSITHARFFLGDEELAANKGFDDSSWQLVGLPHDWSVGLSFDQSCSSGTGYLPGGIGWYRLHVPLGTLCFGPRKRARIVFHGVYKNADVWMNGYHLGGRPSGYAEFSFDVTEILQYAPDDDVVVAVRVDHRDIADSRWYNGSGLTRRVELQIDDEVAVAEHGTTFETVALGEDEATIRIGQTIVNNSDEMVLATVTHRLQCLGTVAEHTYCQTAEIPGGQSRHLSFTQQVDHPLLWSDRHPHLYRLVTSVAYTTGQSERVDNSYEDIVGIRVFAFDPDEGFSINGESRKLKGVCVHEDAGCLGVAVPAVVWLRRLLSLREMGCNAIRMSHNPHCPELYALCDLLGFFVVDEAFDEWENPKNKWWQGHNVYPPKHEGYAHDFPQWYEQDCVAMVNAHKNHPSIIAWSIGNEIDYPNDPYVSELFTQMTGNNDARKPEAERAYDPNKPDIRRATTVARKLTGIVRRQDPSRPVTLAAAFPELSGLTGLLDGLDLIGFNYKEHLYEDSHRQFATQPIIGSENSHGYAQWRAVTDNDYVSGQFLWTGIDYLGEAAGWPVHGSAAGLLTLAGFEKHSWYLRQSWWSEEPVAHIVTRPYRPTADRGTLWSNPVSRSWDEGCEVEILCFSNCDELSLTCQDEEIPLVYDNFAGYWTAQATAVRAPLVLRGCKAGREVVDRLDQSKPPAKIDARIWRVPDWVTSRWQAVVEPGEAVAQIEVALVSSDGERVSQDLVVTASVSQGTLMGVENGDLADNSPYTSDSRRTLDGRLIVYVRCHANTTVRLSAQGLPDVTVECGVS